MPISISGDGTITGVSVGGLPDGMVDTDMLATSAVSAAKLGTNSFVSYAVICDEKAQDTNAGTFTSGAWRTRDLNTEITDIDSIVSISSNQFTLGAGSYLIKWYTPALRVEHHISRLQDITNTATRGVGRTAYTDATGSLADSVSIGAARVSIAGDTVYEIQHRCVTTRDNNGFGLASNIASTAEIYTIVEIFKEA